MNERASIHGEDDCCCRPPRYAKSVLPAQAFESFEPGGSDISSYRQRPQLRAGTARITQIANAVGYGSEAALTGLSRPNLELHRVLLRAAHGGDQNRPQTRERGLCTFLIAISSHQPRRPAGENDVNQRRCLSGRAPMLVPPR